MRQVKTGRQCISAVVLAAVAFVGVESVALAQTAAINGSAANFDVANNQGEDAHGFEVEFEGVQPEDVASTFDTQRYGPPRIDATSTGIVVRWTSAYDGTAFVASTTPHDPAAPLAGSCYQWAGDSYASSGCEHFGVTLTTNASRTTYRWLTADPARPGSLVPGSMPIIVAAPAYSVAAPAVNGGAPVLNADVDAPPAAGFPTRYGDAFWMKVFKTQLNRSVRLDELTSDNPTVVPDDAAHVEASWTLIQADPLIQFSGGNKSRTRTRNAGPIAGDTAAVVRRYELYEYTGLYDPFFHQAICADGDCGAPAPGEVGALVSAQMSAANVVVPSVTVTKIGGGKVESKDKSIACGATCAASYASGAVVTLSASPTSGYVFDSWSGACTGTGACTLVVTEHVNIAASFVAKKTTTSPTAPSSPTPTTAPAATSPTPTSSGGGGSTSLVSVSVGLSNKGSVVANGAAISCPGACSAKVPAGSSVTLTAVPTIAAFVNWSGACSGTQPTCTFIPTKDSQVQAVFAK